MRPERKQVLNRQSPPVSILGLKIIFDKNFEFFGTLDDSGRVLALSGRLFERTSNQREAAQGPAVF